jgi:hypothetical protein
MKPLYLAKQGLPVFPCNPADKRPLTAHGFHDATNDLGKVEGWWRRWPNALIGTPTGHRFGVLDIDATKHPASLGWFVEHAGDLVISRRHHTRSGGFHVLLKPNPKFTCSSGKIKLGVDTRGLGGYIIWWPAHGLDVENPTSILPVPDWLLEKLHPPARRRTTSARDNYVPGRGVDRSVAGILRKIVSAAEGQRNSVTFWGACRFAELVREGKLREGDALDIIVKAAARNGLQANEALRTAQSAFQTVGV